MSDSTLYNALLEDDRKIGYKVVSEYNSRSYSPATPSALQRIRYRINRETRQERDEYGPMAIFETLEQAREFAVEVDGHILEVEYEPSAETELWKKNPPSFCRNRFGGGYHAESNGKAKRALEDCPDGTILASSVYPLEVIE